MSKADDIRKKMANRGTTQAVTHRQTITIQPIPQEQEAEKEVAPEPEAPKAKTSITRAAKPSKPEIQPENDELVALFAKVPKEDKRWLDHYRIDEHKDLGVLVSEAINLLRKQAEKG